MDAYLFDEFARLEDRHWWFRGRRDVILNVMDRHLPATRPLRILDVGCGTGLMMEAMGRYGRVDGLETSPDARAYCRKRLGADITLYEAHLPGGVPADVKYDVLTAFDVIEHIKEPIPALQAIRGALKHDGLFVCTVPAFPFLWSDHDVQNQHFRRHTRASLFAELEASGFKVEWSSYFNTLLFPPVAAVRTLGKVMEKLRKPPPADAPKASDLASIPPGPVNALLAGLFSLEKHLVSAVPLPFGVSLAAVARPV